MGYGASNLSLDVVWWQPTSKDKLTILYKDVRF